MIFRSRDLAEPVYGSVTRSRSRNHRNTGASNTEAMAQSLVFEEVGSRTLRGGANTPRDERRAEAACVIAMALACNPKLLIADEPTLRST